MKTNSVTKQSVQFRVWDENQCEQVANAAYRILGRTGCTIDNEEARGILKDAGCTVEGKQVWIPAGLIQWAVDRAPSAIQFFNRDGEPAMKLEPFEVNFGPSITATHVIDRETGKKRIAGMKDAVEAITVIDACDNIKWASAMVSISDYDESIADVAEVIACVSNTNKPLMYWAQSVENLAAEFEMFELVAGGADTFCRKPFAINLVCPMGPLNHTQDGMAQLIYMAKKRSPMVYIPGVGFGLTGPISLAGGIAIGIADALVGLVVAQLVSPGTPYVAAKFNDNIDMATMAVVHSRPEMNLAQMATGDVFRYMGLPFCSNLAGSDSGHLDQVLVFDRVAAGYCAMLSGCNMNFGLGSSEAGGICRLEDFVFSNEMIEYLKVLTGGIEISEETLSEDEIDEVGPNGNYMMTESTCEHLRDLWSPDIITARACEDDAPDLAAKCLARAIEIVEAGTKHPLAESTVKQLEEILERMKA